jgi:hypothetical protein
MVPWPPAACSALIAWLLCCGAAPASAAEIDTGSALHLSWTNEVRLGTNYMPKPSLLYPAGPFFPAAEGGQGYPAAYRPAGFTAGRLDWLSALDLDAAGFGLRLAATAWDDAVGQGSYGRQSEGILAELPGAGRFLLLPVAGAASRRIELRDGFLHAALTPGDQKLTLRLGRHVLVWGESVYFSENGIAGAMAPANGAGGYGGSAYQSADAFLPVGQASFSWQPLGDLAIEGYWQFEYRANRPASDYDYFYGLPESLLGPAGRAQLAAASGWSPTYLVRQATETPAGLDQFGLALRWHHEAVDYGFYGLSFDAKSPVTVLSVPGLSPADPYAPPPSGHYGLVYPHGVHLVGASLSGTIGDVTIGAEISGRFGMPLVSEAIVVPSGGSGGVPYPSGDTVQAQFSWSYATPPLPGIPAGASWTAEIAANDLVGGISNAGQPMPGRTRFAAAFRTVLAPQFFQVLPRLDLTLPVGFGYDLLGRSAVDPLMNHGAGDVELGVTATLEQVWRGSLQFTHYLGKPAVTLVPYDGTGVGRPPGVGDFLSVSIDRSF